jgi:hypothetical protein
VQANNALMVAIQTKNFSSIGHQLYHPQGILVADTPPLWIHGAIGAKGVIPFSKTQKFFRIVSCLSINIR